ncbi:type IV pilus modification PilV family protein [Wolbachia endosymbiont of Folsomia candida]|uniref:type IV pilus modification PilV family protein n=1 Tax=Wolbachia endosymbiont of Folsomia candida TaxID=169402 RepID=UPI000AC2B9C3|nr:hypothetical protein [Wolbachia endosymbiont of Folsomia candida]APR98107.1 hypothetical protein ASM33_02205 [Wolbachia endosymbiont of Folsomia candida]
MSTYVNHRGEYRGTNIGLTFGATISTLSTLAAIGAGIAIFMKPALLLSIGLTLPATLVALGILAISLAAVALLAIYSIRKNNQISEMKGPKIVVCKSHDVLVVTREDYKFIEENLKNSDDNSEFRIDLTTSKSKGVYVAGKYDSANKLGDSMMIKIDVKGSDGNAITGEQLRKTLGFKDGSSELPIDILPSPKVEALKVEKPKAEEQAKESAPTK